jgi:hypothetical protein
MKIAIHYCGGSYVLVSPCGDKDEDSIVSDDLSEVTCIDCIEALREPDLEKPKKGRPKKVKDSE